MLNFNIEMFKRIHRHVPKAKLPDGTSFLKSILPCWYFTTTMIDDDGQYERMTAKIT